MVAKTFKLKGICRQTQKNDPFLIKRNLVERVFHWKNGNMHGVNYRERKSYRVMLNFTACLRIS